MNWIVRSVKLYSANHTNYAAHSCGYELGRETLALRCCVYFIFEKLMSQDLDNEWLVVVVVVFFWAVLLPNLDLEHYSFRNIQKQFKTLVNLHEKLIGLTMMMVHAWSSLLSSDLFSFSFLFSFRFSSLFFYYFFFGLSNQIHWSLSCWTQLRMSWRI